MGAFGGPLNGSLAPQPTDTLLPSGSAWRFFSAPLPPGGGWTATAYDDSLWPVGMARLGYGNDREITRVPYGPDTSQKYLTTWFRRAFVVADPGAIQELKARVTFDDGLIVYINGVEAFRRNLPAGAVSSSTLALTNIQGQAETAWTEISLAPSLLRAGTNVVAAEVHLCSAADEDLGLDLELEAVFAPAPPLAPPTLSASGQAGFGFSSRFGQGYTLLASTNLVDWVVVTNLVGNGSFMRIIDPMAPPPSMRFYKLRLP